MYIYNDAGRYNSKRPKQNNDCVVRTVAIAFNLPYDEAYDLCKAFGRKCSNGMSRDKWEKLLNHHAYASNMKMTKMLFIAEKGVPRMTANQFVKEYPTGIYIIRQAHHLAVIKDGQLHDSFNSGKRCIYLAFCLEKI